MTISSSYDLSREVRVFISSTFRDMDSERNYLVKNIFPQLHKRCSLSGIEFTALDLRWGITEEEAKQGKVIKYCLSEIDRCRPSMPFFIGILGERYGWMPDQEYLVKHRETLDDFGWVEKDIKNEMSITEMEMQYAVLRNPQMKGKAFFFLRESENIPEEFHEKSGSLAAEKLKKLKNLLREQKDFPVHDYHNNEELGKQVEEELWRVIEQYFPKEFDNDPLTLTRKEHATFARSRTTLYIGGEKYYQKMDNHFESDNQPIIITGTGGMGKSALLANWLGHFRKHHPDVFILQHYIGGASDSTDYAQVIRRMIEEMKKEFELNDEIPSEPEKLKDALPIFFAKSSTKGKWILVLDALNQIEDRDNAKLLNWLPDFIPPFVRVYISSTTGSTLKLLQKRDWETITIEPLSIDDRKELINSYLKRYSKNLPIETVKHIAEDKESENPLILRTLLDELRIFGRHRELDQRIEYYISTKSPEEFFDRVLERMEMDYESDHKGMVGEILSLIYCARKGISEKELLEITNIPPLYWSPLYIALENHLIKHSGLLNISHDFFRQTIGSRYFFNEENKIEAHYKLSEYFEKDRLSIRGLQELSFHYRNSNQIEKLTELYLNEDYSRKSFGFDVHEQTEIYFFLTKNLADVRNTECLTRMEQYCEEYEKLSYKNCNHLLYVVKLLIEVYGEKLCQGQNCEGEKNIESLCIKVLEENNKSDLTLQINNYADIHLRLGNINFFNKQYFKAKEHFEIFIKYWLLLWSEKKRITAKLNTTKIELLEQAMSENVPLIEPCEKLGLIYYISKDYELAEIWMKAAISYDEKFSDFAKRPSSCSPDYFRLHYHLGLIYEYQNEIIKATNTYKVAALFMNKEDSLEVKESQALIFEHLGNILYKEKSYIEARSHYLRLLEIWSEFKRLVPSESLISINWRITNIFYYEKDFINTEIWIKNTLKFVNEVMKPNDVLMNETYFGTNQLLGLIYEAKMEYKKAFYTYNNLLKYLKKLQKKEDNKILEIKTSLNRVKNELPLFFNILN